MCGDVAWSIHEQFFDVLEETVDVLPGWKTNSYTNSYTHSYISFLHPGITFVICLDLILVPP